MLFSLALLAVVMLLARRDELQAHGSRHLGGPAQPATECGFWGSMAEGMSCR